MVEIITIGFRHGGIDRHPTEIYCSSISQFISEGVKCVAKIDYRKL